MLRLVSRPGQVTALDLVFYWVTDMDRAAAFYADVLGLEPTRRDGGSWAQFELHGRRFALHGVGEGQPMTPGGATAVFEVADLDEAKAMLAGRGVPIEHEGEVEGFARFCSFLDPDENTVQLIEYSNAAAGGHPPGQGSGT
jgi:predicted enzyme related to lactoylglutathione lyase